MGGVAAFVRSSTIGPLNDRTNKRNKERGVKTIELLHIVVQWKYKLLRGATLPVVIEENSKFRNISKSSQLSTKYDVNII